MTIEPAARALMMVTRERLVGGLLCEMLKSRGYRCTVETDPRTAMARFLADSPGVTIVDLASLDVEGLELIRSIRMADAGAVLIAIVGAGRSPLTAAAYDLGVADVVNRHEDATQILQLMHEAGHDEAGSPHPSLTPILDEPIHALVVDDDAAVRRLLERVLTREGYIVWTASDGIEALDCLEREHVRLMFLDLRLPRLGGLAVLRRLREQRSPPRTVVMSGYADRELMQAAIALGAFDYLHKPLSVDRVLVTATSGLVLDGIGRRSFWNKWRRA